jgi:hypothetical protein
MDRRACLSLILSAFGALAARRVQAREESGAPAGARAAYAEGRWVEAARLAAAANTADGLAFAARALLSQSLLLGASRAAPADLTRARQWAERALALAPRHVEARLQVATALGMQARRSPAVALARQWPQRARALLLAVNRDAPQEAWAHALMGGWHLEALRIGGDGARRFLGADMAKGRAAFATAMSLDPDEPAIPFYYATALLAGDAGAQSGPDALALVRPLEPVAGEVDAFRREVRRRATLLREPLSLRDWPRAARLAKDWL